MNLEELMDEWAKDSNIDFHRLSEESLKISSLHSKYYRLFLQERTRYFKLEADLKVLRLDKYEFYTMGPTEETKELGWRLPPQGRILKNEVQQFIDADQDIIKSVLRLSLCKEKCDFIESIIKSLNGRGFQINTAVTYEKFKNGN